jgi:nitrite reductase (cytochrome c-552)
MSENCSKNSNCVCYPWAGYLFFIVLLIGTFVLGMMIMAVNERRAESAKRSMLFEIGPNEMDAAKWGQNFPRQYDSWKNTQDTSFLTTFGGGRARDYLRTTPEYVVLFAGYGFSKEYNQGRGHWHSIDDVAKSARITDTSPAACWQCKSPDAARLIGEMGVEEFSKKSFKELEGEIKHSISCFDCHDEATLALRSLRPAVLEGFKSLETYKDKGGMDALTHQEKRSAICAQCHSSYHFAEDTGIVTFPWSKGLKAENFEEYYTETKFSDWTHPISGVQMIKTRHPDYELYTTSTHYARGVSCSDCHLPYKTEGAEKFSDHHIRSPLADIAGACSVCHRWNEKDADTQVRLIQGKVKESQDRGRVMLVKAHFDIAACMEIGATDEELASVRNELRYAQMHWDYIASSNGMGFHAPQESHRILTTALDRAAGVRIACAQILAKHGYADEVVYPDCGTKSKAEAVVNKFVAGERPTLLKKPENAAPATPAEPTTTTEPAATTEPQS